MLTEVQKFHFDNKYVFKLVKQDNDTVTLKYPDYKPDIVDRTRTYHYEHGYMRVVDSIIGEKTYEMSAELYRPTAILDLFCQSEDYDMVPELLIVCTKNGKPAKEQNVVNLFAIELTEEQKLEEVRLVSMLSSIVKDGVEFNEDDMNLMFLQKVYYSGGLVV